MAQKSSESLRSVLPDFSSREPVAPQPSSFLPGIYTSAASFSSLCVRGCSARQSVFVSILLACVLLVSHPPTRGHVPVCPDGAPCLPACPVVLVQFTGRSMNGGGNVLPVARETTAAAPSGERGDAAAPAQ
eukprot:6126233-Prymnesium_polylepis.1